MNGMERDWGRLGARIRAARKERKWTQPELGERVGASRATVQNIESGQTFSKITPTLRAIERELGWAEGSVERILAGGEPTPADTPPVVATADTTEVRIAQLPRRVVQALREGGELLDATVLDLGRPGDSGRAIIIVTGQPDATPEQIAQDLAEWAKRDLALRGIVPPDTNGEETAEGA